jgi:hypothetical protein
MEEGRKWITKEQVIETIKERKEEFRDNFV